MSDNATLVQRLLAPHYWMSGSNQGHEGENDAPREAAARIAELEAERDRLNTALLLHNKALVNAEAERDRLLAELEAEQSKLKASVEAWMGSARAANGRITELEAELNRIGELEAMTVRLCDIAKVYMTQEAWLRFDADVQRSVFGR